MRKCLRKNLHFFGNAYNSAKNAHILAVFFALRQKTAKICDIFRGVQKKRKIYGYRKYLRYFLRIAQIIVNITVQNYSL